MSVTCQDVINRAVGYSVANQATILTQNSADLIAKIGQFERDIFTKISSQNRFFYKEAAGTSTVDSANRTFDTAVIGDIERIIRVLLTATSQSIEVVDAEDTVAEIAPRYYLLGTVMTEVGSDWGATGAVGITIGYAAGPAALDPTGSTTQTVTIPDRYADLLSTRLASYLASKDLESRDPAEVSVLDNQYQMRLMSVINSLDMYGGAVRRRFVNPANWRPIPGADT